jgi:aspartate kinase
MLELAASGAQVLQLRSVEYARRHGVRVHVRSSFTEEPGTWIIEEDVRMEQAMISGVAADLSEAKITIQAVPDQPGVAASIFRAAAAEGAFVDMVVQNVSHDGRTDVSFLVPKADLPRLAPAIELAAREIGASGVSVDDGIGKVSLVGAGIKSHPEVVAAMFGAMAAEGINIEMISTSSIRISCVIRGQDADRAVRALHATFDIGGESSARAEHVEGQPAVGGP